MTREQFEEALQPALFKRLRHYAARIVGEWLADDAIQNALGTYEYEEFDLAGDATLSTQLTTRVKQRALNLRAEEQRFIGYSFQDPDETGIPSYELCEELNQDPNESDGEGDGGTLVREVVADEEFDDPADHRHTTEVGDENTGEDEHDDAPIDAEQPCELSSTIEMPHDIGAVFLDMATAGVERDRYLDAHPRARREYLKDKRPLTAAEREELVSLDLRAVKQLLVDFIIQHQQQLDETATNMAWYSGYSAEFHANIVKHLKGHNPGPLTSLPQGRKAQSPGVGHDFCDRLHHHKYGYPPLRLRSCWTCLPADTVHIHSPEPNLMYTHIPSDPPVDIPDLPSHQQAVSRIVRIWPTGRESRRGPDWELEYSYEETHVRRFHPSMADDCSTARRLIRDYLYGSDGLRLHGIAGRTRQPTQRTTQRHPVHIPMEIPWIGGHPIVHALYVRYVGLLKPESRALLWLMDDNFDQEYTQQEIGAGCDLSASTGMAAEQVNDSYAQALAEYFKGSDRSVISRRHDAIREWLCRLQLEDRVWPTWRPQPPATDFLVPADDICRYCGGLLLNTWVDPVRVRLLPAALEGTDAAYLAKRCVNCGDHIDSLTLRRRGHAYAKRDDATLRDTYEPDELQALAQDSGTQPIFVLRKLSRQYTSPLTQDLKLPPRPS